MKASFGSFIVLAILLGVACDSQAKFYSILDLGTLGGTSSSGAAVNDSGQVAGTSKTATGIDHAFLFDGAVMRDLGALLDSPSNGNAINNAGQVAGTYNAGSPRIKAFLFDGNAMRDVGVSGYSSSGAGMNAQGYVVGSAVIYDTQDTPHPYVFNGITSSIAARLPGASYGYALDINDRGTFIGYGDTHSFVIPNGAVHILLNGSDAGALPGSTYAVGTSINNLNQFTGSSNLPGNISHALFNNGTQLIDIGALLGNQSSGGTSINDLGEIIGYATNGPFLYAGGQMFSLSSLVKGGQDWQLQSVNSISNTGFIAGTGMIHGQQHAFLLTPVPSPVHSPWPPLEHSAC